MNTRYHQLFLICFLIVGCTPSPNTPLPSPPTAERMVDTPTPLVSMPTATAVTTADIPCYAGNSEFTITISPFVVVEILEKNSVGSWVQVRVNEVIVCWVELSSLKFDINDLASVPTVNVPTPQISVSTIIPTPTDNTPIAVTMTPIRPLLIRWKILSYDCANGKAIGATIDLDVTGGVPGNPEYRSSPELPIYVIPKQFLSITVYSATTDGEPSGTIEFTVPSFIDNTDLNCAQTDNDGNNPLPKPPPTDPPPTEPPGDPPPTEPPGDPPPTEPPGDPPPTEPPVCYNPQGKVIPCH